MKLFFGGTLHFSSDPPVFASHCDIRPSTDVSDVIVTGTFDQVSYHFASAVVATSSDHEFQMSPDASGRQLFILHEQRLVSKELLMFLGGSELPTSSLSMAPGGCRMVTPLSGTAWATSTMSISHLPSQSPCPLLLRTVQRSMVFPTAHPLRQSRPH